MEKIAALDCCEKFFKDIFGLYGLEYNTETLEQKRSFIAAATKYFILFRLPKSVVTHSAEKYRSTKGDIESHLKSVLEKFYEVYNSCKPEDFIDKYAEYYGIDDRNFAHELKFTSKESRDNTLSSFAKAVKKAYKAKDQKK